LNLTAAGTQGTGPVSNSIAVSGNATLSQTQNPIVGGNNNITNVVAAAITGASGTTLNLQPTQSGTATCVLQLSGDNSGFNGTININAVSGIRPVRLSSTTAGSANATWTINASNILQVAGVAVALGTLNGSGTISNSVAASSATVNVGAGDFSGTIANAGTAVMALNKISTSTLALEGTNTYTGPTAVSNGTLVVNGSITSPVTVYSGGTVGGTGTIRSNLIANAGSTVAPGSAGSIGTLTVSGTITNGGTILMKLNRTNAPASDELSSAKTIIITGSGTLTVTNIGPALQAGDTFTLFNATSYSGLFGLLGSANLPSLPAGLAWNTLGLTNNGTISVVAALTVSVSPASTNIVYGNSVTLTAITNGTGPLTIQWYDNNANQIPNATNATLTLIGPAVSASGNYAVVVTSPFGSATNIALVTIVPANLTITAQPQTIAYGASVPATTVSYNGFVNGDTVSSLTTQPTISSARSGVVAAGTYTGNYTASGATDPNYLIFYAPGDLIVGQVPLTITANPQTITYGTSVPATTVSYNGFVNGDTASSLTTQPTISSALSGVVAAGTYPGNYTASGAVDSNYSISYVPGTLTVNAAPQPTITSIVVANGTATITFAGTNGVTYVTQSTTNLAVNAWIPISTNTPGLGGVWTVTNSIGNVSKQFYRTLIP
jgi:autotransporter-associated beta strand protein